MSDFVNSGNKRDKTESDDEERDNESGGEIQQSGSDTDEKTNKKKRRIQTTNRFTKKKPTNPRRLRPIKAKQRIPDYNSEEFKLRDFNVKMVQALTRSLKTSRTKHKKWKQRYRNTKDEFGEWKIKIEEEKRNPKIQYIDSFGRDGSNVLK
jgi:hypothetical protein